MPIFTGNPNVVPPPAQFVPPRGTMPVPPWFFPWMYGMPGAEFPKAQTERFGPTPRGLLDQKPDMYPEMNMGRPNPWAAQNVADIYSFPKKGLLGVPGTEGAGGRGLGSRGGGLLGSNWRDPRFIQQYETQQGLKPGSLQPPTAQVRPLPSQADAAYNKALASHEAEIAKRIAGRSVDPNAAKYEKALQEHRTTPKPTKQQAMEEFQKAIGHPTPAQMARPVKPTREIMDKLAAARAARAASEGYRLVEDARAWMSANKGKKPFDSKVLADRYNRMDFDQQKIFNNIMFPNDRWE